MSTRPAGQRPRQQRIARGFCSCSLPVVAARLRSVHPVPCGPFPPKSSGRTGRVFVYPPNVGLYTGVGTGSAPGNVGWNTGVTTLTQCGAEPMVAVCTHVHVGTVLTGQT